MVHNTMLLGGLHNNMSIRFVIIGGGSRGRTYERLLELFRAEVKLVAVCDPNSESLEYWRSKNVRLFRDINELIKWDNFDAAIISSPIQHHAEQSVKMLEAGKHVLCEVPACFTLDECWKLRDVAKESKTIYMMSENYCFLREVLIILEMVKRGIFGELTYAECGYIHDVRSLLFNPDGSLTWRGRMLRDFAGICYPTHSIGPVAKWLDIGISDEFVSLLAMKNKPKSIIKYVIENLGEDHPAAKEEFWKCGDSANALILTKRDILVTLRVDIASPRPHNLTYYHLQGTRASYLARRGASEDSVIWIKGVSPGDSLHRSPKLAKWEPLSKYLGMYEHPWWKSVDREVIKGYHAGSDYIMLREFLSSIKENREPYINVYDAVTWSSIIPLSLESIEKRKAIEFPKFR